MQVGAVSWVVGIVVVLLLLVFGGLMMCVRIENPTSRYPTYKAARDAGAMDEGRWIPPFLPHSARNIVETHDIDTNELEITFEYTPGDVGRLPDECVRLGETLEFECNGWGLPISVRLDPSGKGLVNGGRHDT